MNNSGDTTFSPTPADPQGATIHVLPVGRKPAASAVQASLAGPAGGAAPADDRLPQRATSEISLRKLYESTSAMGAQNREMSINAMRAFWDWIRSVIDRLARALGLKAKTPAQLSQEQLTGEKPVAVELDGKDAGGPAGDMLLAEAHRMIEYLRANPIDPAKLADPNGAHEFVQQQVQKLGSYHAVFRARADELDLEINQRCASLGAAAGTAGAVVRAQMEAGQGKLYDKHKEIEALLEELKQTRLAKSRVEVVVRGLMDATEHPQAQPGLGDTLRGALARYMPGVQFSRPKAPTGVVAQRSGQTHATGEAKSRAEELKETKIESGTKRFEDDESHARDGILAKNTLESKVNGGAGASASAENKKAALAEMQRGIESTSGVSPMVSEAASDELTKEALGSPFVAKDGFEALKRLSAKRREKYGYGDLEDDDQGPSRDRDS